MSMWTYDPEIGVITDAEGRQVAAISPKDREVNGPLLTAAPQLVEALEGILIEVNYPPGVWDPDTLERARRALAAAQPDKAAQQ